MLICSGLGFFTIYFAYKLHELLRGLTRDYGVNAPSVKRIVFMRRMLIIMAFVYMAVDWIYDLLLPIYLTISIHESR